MTRDLCPQHDPDLVPDLMAFIEHLKAENKELRKLVKRGRDE